MLSLERKSGGGIGRRCCGATPLYKNSISPYDEVQVIGYRFESCPDYNMKIEITHYGNKSSYEFAHEDVDLDELLRALTDLIKLTGYHIDGELQPVQEDE